ncbi:MAG: hypothetical protein ABR562_03695 [Thermoplasmatota archaeon]
MLVKMRTKATLRMSAVVTVENPTLTMDKAEAQLVAHGNKILARDDEKRSFQIAQAVQERILEAGHFVADAEAVQWGLLPSDTPLVACTAPQCRGGTLFNACTTCTDGRVDGLLCRDCDGGGNDLGGPCPACGGYGQVAQVA